MDIFLFSYHGIWVYILQIIWIPFWAAGVINGFAHFKGYRNFNTNDDSTNIFPWGIIIGVEELHNNHHAYPASAKLSMKWYEFDMGWLWIKLLSLMKLAKVNKIYKLPTYNKNHFVVDENSLEVFMNHRYLVWKMFKTQTKIDVTNQILKMKKNNVEFKLYSLKQLKKIFYELPEKLNMKESELLTKLLHNEVLKTVYLFKESLWKLWNNRQLSNIQLKDGLMQFCDSSRECTNTSIGEFAKKMIWLRPINNCNL
jgi:stearoyl-CoA desaturase (delta-9 desaturase)